MFHSSIHVGCSYGTVIDLFLKIRAVTMTAFFVISGFVNETAFGLNCFDENKKLVGFYARRCISVLPAYYLTAILVDLFVSKTNLKDWLILLPIEMLTLQSVYASLFSIGHNTGTWFISCIMFCYLIFPLIVIMIKEMASRTKLILFFILSFLLLYMPFVSVNFETQSLYSNPLIRIIEFALGMLLASYFKEQHQKRKIIKIYIIAIMLWMASCVLLYIWTIKNGLPKDYMCYSVVFLPIWVICITWFKKIKINNVHIQRCIKFLGGISYDMFLVQFFIWPLERSIDNVIVFNNAERIVFVFALCIILATIMHYSFERPLQKLLKGKMKNET